MLDVAECLLLRLLQAAAGDMMSAFSVNECVMHMTGMQVKVLMGLWAQHDWIHVRGGGAAGERSPCDNPCIISAGTRASSQLVSK